MLRTQKSCELLTHQNVCNYSHALVLGQLFVVLNIYDLALPSCTN